jgi:DNA-binding response OmpR family regulator
MNTCRTLDGHAKKVLVIDDDLDLLMLLERRLVKEGLIIETAASLPEAEEIIDAFAPDMILLDINIHGEDGRQLSWKLKSNPVFNHIRIILMSGFDYNSRRAALFGADELLPKPFFMEYLVQRVQAHILEPSAVSPLPLMETDGKPDPGNFPRQ